MTSSGPANDDDLNPEPSRPSDRQQDHLPPKSYASAAHENLPSNGEKSFAGVAAAAPPPARTEKDSSAQLDGKDQVDAPRTMTSKKKKKAQKAEQRLAEVNGVKGKDDAPTDAKKSEPTDEKNQTKTHLVYEKFEDNKGDGGGEGLMSIETDETYQEGVKRSRAETKENVDVNAQQHGDDAQQEKLQGEVKDSLVSGRRAGAGWDRSG